MDYLLLALQFALGIGIFLLWQWVKDLPAAIHKRQEQLFQQQLTKELELLKISQSQIQLNKIERFIDFAKILTDILTNEEFKSQIKKESPDAIAKLRTLAVELGIGLFFFASDSTVREYGRWKYETSRQGADKFKVLENMGTLMVALRKDVGYDDTSLVADDYLRMFITDWDDIQKPNTT